LASLAALLVAGGCAHHEKAPPARKHVVDEVETELARIHRLKCDLADASCISEIVDRRYRLDESVRDRSFVGGDCLGGLGFSTHKGCDVKHSTLVDRSNARFFETYVQQQGTPFCTDLSPDVQKKLWSIAQRLDDGPAGLVLRAGMLSSVRCAVSKGVLEPYNYAAMFDRLQDYEGRPQAFGTQYRCEKGKPVLILSLTARELETNRASIGMEPLTKSMEQWRKDCAEGGVFAVRR
jgi:hypothetical protein